MLTLLALGCGGAARDDGELGLDAPKAGSAADVGGAAGAGGAGAGRPGAGAPGAAAAASGGLSAGGSASGDRSRVELDGAPFYSRVQRLTNLQWERAVTDVLRFSAPRDLSSTFARPIAGAADFDNNERLLFVDVANFLDFELGAEAAAALATGSAEALAAVYDGTDAAGFVRTVGRRAFRRPLTAEEEARYLALFARGEELYGAGFAHGAALVIRGLLQSPHFLYRTELGPAGDPLTSYEVASKLSFWLRGTTPSDSLLDAADSGELDDVERLEAAARQMLEEPQALEVMRDFHGQLLRVGLYRNVIKPGVPEYDPAIQAELEGASYAFLDRLFQEGLGLRELLTAEQAYVGAGLAPFYGLPAATALELRDVGPARPGYFTQVPFLMLWGADAASDPSARGLALQRLLCDDKHAAEPLGRALEGFDGLGRARDDVEGQPIDARGSYPFADGERAFDGAAELMNVLAESAQTHTCYSKYVTSYALARDLVEADRPLLESLSQVSLTRSLKELVIALVREPAFRMRTEVVP